MTIKRKKTFKIVTKPNPVTTQDKVTYKTSNKKIATVSKKGVIKGLKKGKATITVKYGKRTVKIKVKVTK